MKNFFKGIIGVLLVFSLLQSLYAAEDKSGVVLSFDDTYVDQWHDYFINNTISSDVKVTFFVSHWHTLTPEQIQKLRDLQAAGHEIGNHSYDHKGVAGDYNFDPDRIDEYLNEQIIPSLANMRADGFDPVSFSYPSGERNETYDAAVRQYFPYLRTTFADENHELFQMDDIFHGPNSQYQVLAGDGIDNAYNNPIEEIEAAFLRAKTNNEVVIFYAHRILPDDSPDADYRYGIRISKLNRLIAAAKEMGLKFYTFAEAWQIGNQSVPTGTVMASVEGNQMLVNWNNVDTDFIGIVPTDQSEWQSGMPGAAVSGSSGSVTINIPVANDNQNYVAILYKNYVEVARSGVVTVNGTDPGTGGASPHITYLGYQEGKARFQWVNLPTDYIGIVPATENAWQEGMPWANVQGVAADKIGFRISPQATEQQYIAIFYRNSAEVGRSEVFTIAGTGTGGTGSGTNTSPNITYLGYQEGKARFQWVNLPTDYIGIVPATENAWQEGMPWADVQGSAADKIGFRISPQATEQQYIAIFYRNSAEVGRSEVFTIAGT